RPHGQPGPEPPARNVHPITHHPSPITQRRSSDGGSTAGAPAVMPDVSATPHPSPTTRHPPLNLAPTALPARHSQPRLPAAPPPARPRPSPACPPPPPLPPPPRPGRPTPPRRPRRPATPIPAFPQPPRRQLHRLIDLRVARAPAQIPRQRLLYLLPRRRVVLLQQRPGAHENSRRAEAALRAAGHLERVLERIQPAGPGKPRDRQDLPVDGRECGGDTGRHRLSVQQYGTGATVALVAPLRRSGQAEHVAEGFQQGEVGRNGGLAALAVDVE